ncbi:30S ribosomal protein S17 [Brachybacterium halotolerans subsp. kimchii]|jgi:small subunit ribosomal protein S17|uniref:Small ribosomal subunit protein uS17 n=2 Tax=Brachybacterium TaxID=43668 RepID=A0ABS1B988_9MICO|nr:MULTISPECIES: 30S ribosomal protein S17 [Brachybacterium]MBK0331224.1 30S ribosomal protein S17 [Brachybacterium halotolerans]MCG7308691.1 30S ribosomal protein S17 [Brachybacterium sp. ACRRE]UEJ82311.1 30S ribosomal protein S17 [Brachybacterium halotolerans subsp. kimchii]UQN29792.1 30S ribosomal protein S17 [Brachybacterium kimchii]
MNDNVHEDAAVEGHHASSHDRPYRKTLRGYVVSDKMDKTIVVEVEERVKHSLYGKVMTKTKKFKAHDEENTAGIGDQVLLMETRPLSASKHWRLVEIIEKAK